MAVVSSFVVPVSVSTPASARVETTGLSTISTSGALPCCAASRTLLVRSVVSYPVRLTVTPAPVPHLVSSCTQAELLSNCGYGSQIVYVPDWPAEVPDAAGEPQAVAAPAASSSAVSAAAARRRDGVVEGMTVSLSRGAGCG